VILAMWVYIINYLPQLSLKSLQILLPEEVFRLIKTASKVKLFYRINLKTSMTIDQDFLNTFITLLKKNLNFLKKTLMSKNYLTRSLFFLKFSHNSLLSISTYLILLKRLMEMSFSWWLTTSCKLRDFSTR